MHFMGAPHDWWTTVGYRERAAMEGVVYAVSFSAVWLGVLRDPRRRASEVWVAVPLLGARAFGASRCWLA